MVTVMLPLGAVGKIGTGRTHRNDPMGKSQGLYLKCGLFLLVILSDISQELERNATLTLHRFWTLSNPELMSSGGTFWKWRTDTELASDSVASYISVIFVCLHPHVSAHCKLLRVLITPDFSVQPLNEP